MTNTRRDLLTGSVALVAAPLMPMGTMPPGAESDEPIIGLYSAWERARTAFLAALDRLAKVEDAYFASKHAKLPLPRFSEAVKAAREDEAATSGLDHDATRALLATPSRTVQGVLLKLRRAAFDIHNDHTKGFDLAELENVPAAVITCLADLERLTAGGAA